MLDISNGKIARVIMLIRNYGPDSVKLADYISGMNDDEKASLVALLWVGRESFAPEDIEQAKEEAMREATAPTERYLSGIPGLAEYLEDGLEQLGIDVTEVEDNL